MNIKQIAALSIIPALLAACGGDNGAGGATDGNTGGVTNTSPTLVGLVDTSITAGNTSAEQFTIGDAETSADKLTVTAVSDNTTVIPASGLVLSGTTSARTLTITPAADQSGTAHITVTVSDGQLTKTATIAVTVTAGAVDPNALQTSVPTPTYASGSIELNIFNAINTARQSYGAGLVAQDMNIDTAARNHSNYLAADTAGTSVDAHSEVSTKPGYTGAFPSDRMTAAGYKARSVGEVIVPIVPNSYSNDVMASLAVDTWLSAPYHRLTILSPYRDLGIGIAKQQGAAPLVFNTVDFGVKDTAKIQLPTTAWVGVWPMPGAANVRYGFGRETPNPIPENGGMCSGYPVSIQSRYDITLTVGTFTLAETTTNNPISVKLITTATDPNNALPANTALIIPYAPLKLGTQYTANFTGTVNGVTYSKTWAFVTASQDGTATYGCSPSK